MMRRLLREPLLHFTLLGAALFGGYRWVSVPADDQATIVVSAERIASISAQFGAVHGGRPPDDAELRGLIDAYTRDEMLYREGLALGLDRDDPVVRNRVRQKTETLSGDVLASEPTDADLRAYLEAHRAEFDIPGLVSFDQVYFDPRRHATVDAEVERARTALKSGRSPASLGDATMLPPSLTNARPDDVARDFGEAFRTRIDELTGTGWQGPVESTFGLHLVRVTRRDPVVHVTLDDARDAVAREWTRATLEAKKADFYRALAKRYRVEIEEVPAGSQAVATEVRR